MRPVSSASGMKSTGATMPRSGWCQRSSASKPRTAGLLEIDDRLVVELELALGERLAEIELERAARLHARVHVRLEEAVDAAASALAR